MKCQACRSATATVKVVAGDGETKLKTCPACAAEDRRYYTVEQLLRMPASRRRRVVCSEVAKTIIGRTRHPGGLEGLQWSIRSSTSACLSTAGFLADGRRAS